MSDAGVSAAGEAPRVIRLLIADDEHLIRGALSALLNLEADIEVVASVDNGVAATEQALELQPDVCLLDLEMPQADGIEAATRILATVATKVVIVTRHARPGVLRRALAARVSGFVPKSTPAEDLAAVIRDVVAGKRYIDAEIAATALTADRCPLTDRELDALRFSRSTMSVQQIADALHLAPGTVRNYLSSAMTKLDARSRHDAADKAWQQGWI
ncbi:response regulator transcription factor [Salinibacterium sp. NSLL150]|uniref:response regulator transcription factor n=1 Tax=unclassified Salinibacterium TaxID=2632331 RepID=UPI0018CF9589|nr:MULTISPECIES: response regulator transcription factor [unclassified Salinibacterium]MBH0098020.1 response regulator transcription factor [Salinibacterium sp. NSLL35]MBH0100775.1 response regulator transcription factor [Salinibacterium sp. NSLL150]MBH0103534.1 response regulator transcription factor [Salinibacterium sp. NSLL16]MBH0106295.1 response regulator transcription factor [Salinibacterium sp. NSLL17]